MLLVREIMYCKPGKVKELAGKFVAMSKLSQKMGMPPMKVMTDFSAERYWTVVSEFEVKDLKSLEDMFTNTGGNPDDMKEMEKLMQGYHDLVDHGKREIYKLEN